MKKLFNLWAIIACLAFASCENEDPIPADANDNFITSFVLTTTDGTSYSAVIEGENITVAIPYNVSLNGATAAVEYTKSATILPDPTTISDWDNEQIFQVTSYNGDVNEYTYRVNHEEITQEGDMELKTMSEIAAFAEAGTSVINGNLTIGTDDGEAITSLENLSNLKVVKGNLILKNSISATDLTGLENIETLGGFIVGSVDEVSNSALNLVTMNALTEITGDLIARTNSLKWIKLDALQKVGGNVVLASTVIESIETPVLAEIGGSLDLCGVTEISDDQYGNKVMGGEIIELTFPSLEKVLGDVKINYFAMLTNISFPKLTTAGSVEIPTLSHQFETIDLSSLTTVEGNLSIESYRSKGAFASDASSNNTLTSLGDFTKLQSIGGYLRITNFNGMTALPDLSNLKSVKSIYLEYLALVENELNVSNVTFTEDSKIEIYYDCEISAIIGSGDMPGEINIHTKTKKLTTPHIKGFTSVNNITVQITLAKNDPELSSTIVYDFETVTGDLIFDYQFPTAQNIDFTFPNLKEIKGVFALNNLQASNPATKLDAPKLETIGGQFFFNAVKEYSMPKLTSVGCAEGAKVILTDRNTGNATAEIGMMDINIRYAESINFPMLSRVGGNGLVIECSSATIETISFPSLSTIDGHLYIFGGRVPPVKNKNVKHLSFPNLEHASKVTISQFTNMLDFSTFEKLVTSGSVNEENWSVTSCGYNPTYQDMKEGRYTQQ